MWRKELGTFHLGEAESSELELWSVQSEKRSGSKIQFRNWIEEVPVSASCSLPQTQRTPQNCLP